MACFKCAATYLQGDAGVYISLVGLCGKLSCEHDSTQSSLDSTYLVDCLGCAERYMIYTRPFWQYCL